MKPTIIYTKTDEAPALATMSLLPIVKKFAKEAGIDVKVKNISLSARILAKFNDVLSEKQKVADALSELGKAVKSDDTNIIKLPNISASLVQIKAAIKELQDKGFKLPNYPQEPKDKSEEETKAKYDKIKGSAVNPVLREGNSDRRAPLAVKNYAKANPHSMGAWSSESKSHVSSMDNGDFYERDNSTLVKSPTTATIVFIDKTGRETILKETTSLLKDEIIDSAVLSKRALREFLSKEMDNAKKEGVLFSLHLKATMMKVSDPVLFGHAVYLFLQPVFDKYNSLFIELGINADNGLGDLYSKISALNRDKQIEIESDIKECLNSRPALAMVNSDLGITNLHVSSDIIIDASMPAAIRSSGKMWNPDGKLQDMKAVIPDRCYAGIYQETIDFCKKHGAFDPTTMGSVSNVGLMAQKAEEYGSHDKTFVIKANGKVEIRDSSSLVLLEQDVEEGDLFRACQVKDAPIKNWIELAVDRARKTGNPAIFWLDKKRGHDREIIKKVNSYLPLHDIDGLEIKIMSPIEATCYSLERIKAGKDTISVTGNVLRDYLTDLFPIMELGTSAKMLSIVPLMNGGGLFETGAGGSAPKHVQQFVKENHLRWDSLGEFLALAVSFEHLGFKFDNKKALILSTTLNCAIESLLKNGKSPSRKVDEIDNRGSHFFLALYWAKELANQTENSDLSVAFKSLAQKLQENEDKIVKELIFAQGCEVDLGGYYYPDETKANSAMRPSGVFNSILGA